jgi:hypothetical protein
VAERDATPIRHDGETPVYAEYAIWPIDRVPKWVKRFIVETFEPVCNCQVKSDCCPKGGVRRTLISRGA